MIVVGVGVIVQESDYFTAAGEFRVDRGGSKVLQNCLMYKMCYYRFGEVHTEQGIAINTRHPDPLRSAP